MNRISVYLSILLGGLLLLIAGGMIGWLAGYKQPSQYTIVNVADAWTIAVGILLLGLFMIAMGLYLRFHKSRAV